VSRPHPTLSKGEGFKISINKFLPFGEVRRGYDKKLYKNSMEKP